MVMSEEPMKNWYIMYKGSAPLCQAARERRLDLVKWLLKEKKGKIGEKDEVNWTPLHCGAMGGDLQVVKFLVEDQRADVEAKDNYNNTPLHCAAQFGHLEVEVSG
eukprot:Selendium_serpulae@DN6714_c0_g1_i1.p1